METSENINELSAALAKAQGTLNGSRKDSINPFFKTKYSNLSSVWDACRLPLSENGLSVIQANTVDPDHPDYCVLETQLMHSSGQWIRSRLMMKPVKSDPQSIGSCISYLRRYSLASMVGVTPEAEDDDGNAASGNHDKSIDNQKAIDIWIDHVNQLVQSCTIEDFRAFWPDHKEEITHDCGQTGAAKVYAHIVSVGKRLASRKIGDV